MRVARLLGAFFLMFVGLSVPAFAVGLHVERLADASVKICPVCHRVIASGRIHVNAEDIVMTQFGGGLIDAGMKYTTEPGEALRLDVLIYRFQERQGGNFSVERPASVGFHVHLFDQSGLVKVFVFDETQAPLLDNAFHFFTFLKRKARWITVEELSREGVRKALDFFANDLRAAAPEGAE